MAAIVLDVTQLPSGGDFTGALTRTTLSDVNTYSFRNTGNERIAIIPSLTAAAGSITVNGVKNSAGLDGGFTLATNNPALFFVTQTFPSTNYSKPDGYVDISVSAGTNADIVIFRSV